GRPPGRWWSSPTPPSAPPRRPRQYPARPRTPWPAPRRLVPPASGSCPAPSAVRFHGVLLFPARYAHLLFGAAGTPSCPGAAGAAPTDTLGKAAARNRTPAEIPPLPVQPSERHPLTGDGMHPAYSSRIPVLLAAGGIGGIVAIVAGIVIAAAAPSTEPVLVAAAARSHPAAPSP